MKKMMKPIQMMAALLVAAAATTACTSDDVVAGKPTENKTDAPKTYTLTVEATMGGGDAATRALGFDKGALIATWTEGDVVTVEEYIEDGGSGISRVPEQYGTLKATDVSDDGRTCTLTGKVTSDFTKGKWLTLKYLSGNYSGQDGTLEYIAEHCDYAIATVTIEETMETDIRNQALRATPAAFKNQQAIVKFTLTDKETDDDIAATQLNVKVRRSDASTMTYKVTPAAATNVLYMALPDVSSARITLDATMADGNHRYYQKSGVTFENSQYYTVGVKMNMGTVDLSALTADYDAKDGDVLYGTLPPDIKLSVKSGAEITLNNVTTQKCLDILEHDFPGIECLGNATINLGGPSMVIASGNFRPGIFVPKGKTLTIQGNGTLNVSGLPSNAGIGGGDSGTDYKDCGNITIKGGNITATGGSGAAGIGSVDTGSCGNIKISGGTVTATGGSRAAGIGSGNGGSCGSITISGGSGTATKGEGKTCSIGKGHKGTCGTVKVNGKTYKNGIEDSPFTW